MSNTTIHSSIIHAHDMLNRRAHLPLGLQEVGAKFRELGDQIFDDTEHHGPETAPALRKLFEIKNAIIAQHCMIDDEKAPRV